MRSNQRGFTLLEVLVAGFILFLVINSSTMIYRAALLSSGKAEKSLMITSAVPSIRMIISDIFRENGHSAARAGEGSFGELTYLWTAKLRYEGLPRETLESRPRNLRYYLWEVRLTIKKGNLTRRYTFNEVTS